MNRGEHSIIAGWVGEGERVLDLGCGDGELLADLTARRRVRGYGIDIADANVLACVRRGVNVIQSDLESGLAGFRDRSFDTVILSQTLQQIHRVEVIIREMLRVGREVIVTFPNFAYWRHRVQLGLRGTMPVSKTLPYEWYNTPNVRMFTVTEFDRFCAARGIDVVDREVLSDERTVTFAPNLFGQLAFYRIRQRSAPRAH
jgi:methionine biosynthesis protein MetW